MTTRNRATHRQPMPTTPPHKAPPPVPQGRCMTCGYDLRGSASEVCPECGTPKHGEPVVFHDPQMFYRARAVLEEEGLLLRAQNYGGMLGAFGVAYGVSQAVGVLWIAMRDLERAENVLEERGIMTLIGTKPIVDRSAPACPRCEARLDPNASPPCPTCGTEFEWVDIDEPKVDPTGLHCAECGYDLTGLTSGRCPECAAPLPADLDRLVAEATADPVGAGGDAADRAKSEGSVALQSGLGAVIGVISLALIALAATMLANNARSLPIGVVITAIVLTVLAYVCFRLAYAQFSSKPNE